MNGLTFHPSPLALVAGILFLLAMAVLSFLAWRRRSTRRGSFLALELLRWTLALLAVFTLWKPEWHTLVYPDQLAQVAVLSDGSRSMTTQDVIVSGAADSLMTRADWLQQQEETVFWEPLEKNYEVVRGVFSPLNDSDDVSTAAEGTDINAALEAVLNQLPGLRAVVLLSDGDWNLGETPVNAATKLRLRNIPVYAIAVGSPRVLPDLDLVNVSAPTYGIVDEPILIPFTVRSSLTSDVQANVRLVADSGETVSKEVTIPAMSEIQESIFWTPKTEGSFTLTMDVPVQQEELRKDNNSKAFQIAARRENLKVLVVDSLPRWEYRYLRNALSRDPGVDVRCLLFHPQIGVGGGHDYVKVFPETIEDLAPYDVVFIGDVGISPDELTLENAEHLKGLVEQQASGLVFLPGPRGRQMTLLESPLKDLIPVTLDEDTPKGVGTPSPSSLVLTNFGKGSLLTLLADTEEENPPVWRGLPGFYWHAPVLKSKAGAEVLAVHQTNRNQWGRIPLLVTRPAGNGKVLFMGIDSAWRWRRGVEDKYHYRFWGQVARWMAYQRNMAEGERIRLIYSPDRPETGQTVMLNATIMSAGGAPLKGGNVSAVITDPLGNTEVVSLTSTGAGWGVFQNSFKPRLAGNYNIRIDAPDAAAVYETGILVQGTEKEEVGKPARVDVMSEIASITRGQLGDPQALQDFVREITGLPTPEPQVRTVRIWAHPYWVSAIIVLFAVFWVGRKLVGVI